MNRTGVLRQRGFVRLWTAAFFSETAEWMLQVALPVLVYQLTGSAASTATSMMFGLLPAVLMSPLAGVLADRYERRVVLCLVCAGQAVVAVPLLIVDGGGALPVVFLVIAAQASLAALFEPARNALVPDLVPADELTAANGLMGMNSSVARLVGASLGGLLLGFAGLHWVMAAYLAALVLAGALLLPRFPARAGTPDAGAHRQAMVRQWLAGLAAIRGDRTLRITGVTLLLSAIAQGMFLVLFVLFVLRTLGGGEPEVGLLRGVQAVGGLAAGLLVATALRRVRPAALLGWGTLSVGLLSVLIWHLPAITTEFWLYVGLFALVGAPGVISAAGLMSVLQTTAGTELAGRVLSTGFAAMAAGMAGGMQLAGMFADRVGLPGLLTVQAALHVLAGLVALAFLVRGRRSVGTDTPEKADTVESCHTCSPPATCTSPTGETNPSSTTSAPKAATTG
ncbi:Predicted arabinose efflux permease, MFS family [Amycolatopsis marina]|uniref:Predicted arabinose efflux permease, MFS family n=1 Tax=Amycolatopsis marina TaxID=490629 RepID=A0A1I1CB84_9PSEU|nr:MFS transporter [Amycolatopsis marina]SFB58010.1 Predicted arabinose efflux permease, MFS family [Amycolatopsis marina]